MPFKEKFLLSREECFDFSLFIGVRGAPGDRRPYRDNPR